MVIETYVIDTDHGQMEITWDGEQFRGDPTLVKVIGYVLAQEQLTPLIPGSIVVHTCEFDRRWNAVWEACSWCWGKGFTIVGPPNPFPTDPHADRVYGPERNFPLVRLPTASASSDEGTAGHGGGSGSRHQRWHGPFI